MTMLKVGDSVVCNGFQGTVSAFTANGMIEVRLASGAVCVDPSDALTVQPGSVWEHMQKAAQSDMRKARKEGSILICDTRYGTVELTYIAASRKYEAFTMGPASRFIASGKSADVVERLASVYQVTLG
jgi:hypothetical protein